MKPILMGPFSADHAGKGLKTKRHTTAANKAVNHFFFIVPLLPVCCLCQQETPLIADDYMNGVNDVSRDIF
jgi:hypothetical protein